MNGLQVHQPEDGFSGDLLIRTLASLAARPHQSMVIIIIVTTIKEQLVVKENSVIHVEVIWTSEGMRSALFSTMASILNMQFVMKVYMTICYRSHYICFLSFFLKYFFLKIY
jgi:hypothetical protein